jgi:hypothetical protein
LGTSGWARSYSRSHFRAKASSARFFASCLRRNRRRALTASLRASSFARTAAFFVASRSCLDSAGVDFFILLFFSRFFSASCFFSLLGYLFAGSLLSLRRHIFTPLSQWIETYTNDHTRYIHQIATKCKQL